MKTVNEKNYGNISLPKQMIQEIKRVIQRRGDYSSIAEFVKDAIRRRLEEISYDDSDFASGSVVGVGGKNKKEAEADSDA